MLLIKCPWCGERAETEFTYAGDGTVRRPDPAGASDEEWLDHIYLRGNPMGEHDELWHHTSGCRQYVKVRRNVRTHEILRTGKPDETFSEDTV